MYQETKLSIQAVIAAYPIAHELEGWFFRVDRLSANHWRAQGMDLSGRKVSSDGESEDVLFECVSNAKAMRNAI